MPPELAVLFLFQQHNSDSRWQGQLNFRIINYSVIMSGVGDMEMGDKHRLKLHAPQAKSADKA